MKRIMLTIISIALILSASAYAGIPTDCASEECNSVPEPGTFALLALALGTAAAIKFKNRNK